MASNIKVDATQEPNIPIILTPERDPSVVLTPEKVWGTKNYENLENKPQINGVELNKNVTLDQLGVSTEQIDQNTEDIVDIYDYLDTVTPKNTSEKDNPIQIDDALKLPVFQTVIEGKLQQQTTEGYNLYNNDFLVSSNSATISRTRISNGMKITINSVKEGATTRGFYLPFKPILDQYDLTDGEKILIKYDFKTSNSNAFPPYFGDWEQGLEKTYSPSGDKTYTAWTTRTLIAKYNKNAAYGALIFYSSFINAGDVFEIKNIMICRSDKDMDYEMPTGGSASPSLLYPQEVQTIKSYNLFDGEIELGSINSTTGENVSYQGRKRSKNYIKVEPNTFYYFGFSTTDTRWVIGYDKNKQVIADGGVGGYSSALYKGTPSSEKSFQTSATTEYIRWYDIASTDLTEKVQLIKGTISQTYLPYGCLSYKITGKNLLDFDTFQWLDATYNKEDGTVTLNGKGGNILRFNRQLFKADKAYYQKVELISGEVTGVQGHYGIMDTSGKAFMASETYYPVQYTTDTTRGGLWVHDQAVYNNAKFKIWAAEGKTDFQPYQEQKCIPLDLKGNWIGAISNDIKDYLITNKKKYWLVKNVGKYTVTGDEDWFVSGRTNETVFAASVDIRLTKHTTGICTHFQYGGDSKINNFAFINPMSNGILQHLTVTMDIKHIPNLETFKNKIKELYNKGTPVEIYYALIEPQIIELGEIHEQIITLNNDNCIQLLTNLDSNMQITYPLDIKKYYDNKIAAISSQII